MKERTAEWLCRTRDAGKAAFVWNSLSACLSSFQTMILLLVLTRLGSSTDSGYLVMGYSVGNIMLNIGKFGMRQYQVTDAKEVYSYGEYVRSRIFSLSVMVFFLALYLVWGAAANGYTPQKTAVVGMICCVKGIEAAEDVLHGRMQQMGRLDVAGKILSIRFFVFIAGFIACYAATRSLVLTTALSLLLTLLLCVALNGAVIPRFRPAGGTGRTERRFPAGLLLQCLPLCVSMVLNIFLGNAPKYIIDGIVSDEVQTCFNIAFMPALVVALLSGFVFSPILKKIGTLWTERRIGELRRLTLKLTLVPVAIDAAVVAAGYFFGLPVLGFVYGVDLSGYKGVLIIALVASGVMAMLNLYADLLTAMRRQRHLFFAYGAGSAVMALAGRPVLRSAGLQALCRMYLAVMAAVVLYCMAVYLATVRKAPGLTEAEARK